MAKQISYAEKQELAEIRRNRAISWKKRLERRKINRIFYKNKNKRKTTTTN